MLSNPGIQKLQLAVKVSLIVKHYVKKSKYDYIRQQVRIEW